MKEKFEVNGYVMPQVMHWEWDMTCMSEFGLEYPEVILFEGGLTHIRGLLKTRRWNPEFKSYDGFGDLQCR